MKRTLSILVVWASYRSFSWTTSLSIAAMAAVSLVILPNLFATSSPGSFTQAPSGTLSGVVALPGGDGIPASITVTRENLQKTVAADRAGRFRLDGLAPGTYRAQARLFGFVTNTAEIQIFADRETVWHAEMKDINAYTDEPPSGSDPTDSAVASAIYQVVLKHVYNGSVPSRPRIASTSLIQPFNPIDWLGPAGTPIALRERSASASARRPVLLRSESFPKGARLVDRPSMNDYPYTSFSRVFLTTDGLDALVVFAHSCGNLCGESKIVWLRRESPSGVWGIRESYRFSIS